MTNSTSIRNIKLLCDSSKTGDASLFAKEHDGAAQVLGREIGELVREHNEYLHLIAPMRAGISMAAMPLTNDPQLMSYRGSVEQQEKQRTTAMNAFHASVTEMEKKLKEMQARLDTIAVGIKALKG